MQKAEKAEKAKTDEIRRLESEVKRLKVALADSTFKQNALESLIVVVNRHYQTDVKKNFGSKLSGIVGKKKEKV
jgi:hypothetical protein